MKPLFQILSGNAGAAGLLLLRNLLIAHFLGLEDYGIAASFAIVLSAAEMCINLGLPQLSVQSPRSGAPEFQANLHAIQMIRGLAVAAIFYLLGPWFAALFQVPDLAWAYQVLAIVPLIGMFLHLDAFRLQRQMEFLPSMWMQLTPALSSLVVVAVLTQVLNDHRVMIAASVTAMLLTVLMSHLVAQQRYRIRLSHRDMKDVLSKGLPLAMNGILLFCVFHGEKIIVGRLMDLSSLAILSMGLTLTLVPAQVAARSLQNYFLPQLSKPLGDLATRASKAILWASVLSLALALILLFVANLVVHSLGSKFGALLPLLPLLVALNALRVLRAGPSVVALSQGAVGNAALSNLPRVLALGAIAWAVILGGGLQTILIIAICAEALGVVISFAALRWRTGLPLGTMVGPAACAGIGFALIAVGAAAWAPLPLSAMATGAILRHGSLRALAT